MTPALYWGDNEMVKNWQSITFVKMAALPFENKTYTKLNLSHKAEDLGKGRQLMSFGIGTNLFLS